MIVKIVEKDGKLIGGIQIYENSFDGRTKVQDTFHVDVEENSFDTIFGTNDSEVVVYIDKEVMQLRDLVTDAISFFKMVGASDELSNKGFDTGDIMTVEYCEEIVKLCKKYGIKCDDTIPYGVLDAEYELEKFFKSKLEGGEQE